ncbi:MAG: hypothetical protein CV081_04805 [Nitrospira sp. LK265]|nr:hypothetical protein [Nitrospira sp. LK265]
MWSAFLTAVAIVCIAFLVWEVTMHVRARTKDASLHDAPARYRSILAASSLLVMWIPLAAYSFTYLNFGLRNAQPAVEMLLVAVAVTFFVMLSTWLLEIDAPLVSKVTVTLLSALAAIAGILAKFDARIFNNLVDTATKTEIIYLIITYLFIVAGLGAAASMVSPSNH